MLREPRRICVVTGTRAEFGLLRSTLLAITAHPKLELQLVVTGMHLDPSRGRTINTIRSAGWKIDGIVSWPMAPEDARPQIHAARCTGRAIQELAETFEKLNSEIVLVVGDRVEAFAAATAAQLSGKTVAHVHGGDRALGIADDVLRHAITKLAHLHFPATRRSADRIRRLGEDGWRIHRVGSPGLDDLGDAEPTTAIRSHFPEIEPRRFALLIVHPESADEAQSERFARAVLHATRADGPEKLLAIHPNNDPGSAGIMQCWKKASSDRGALQSVGDLPRHLFLGLLRDAAMLVGNSSSGIIEAASFGTPVVDVGTRQQGRERGMNVTTVSNRPLAIRHAVAAIWRDGNPIRYRGKNIYGGSQAGQAIADVLASVDVSKHVRKIIAY